MNEGDLNQQLLEQNEQLKYEIELLKAKICELEARLAQYENAHTPPSLRRGRNRKDCRHDSLMNRGSFLITQRPQDLSQNNLRS